MDSTDMTYGMNETMSTSGSSATDAAISAGAMTVIVLIYLAIFVLVIVSMWKLFVKAGRPGWASIVPIYNSYMVTQIAGRPWWWLLLMLIPIVGLIFAVIIVIDFVKSYGKGTGFAVLALFFPFIAYPIMALDKNVVYVGPAGPDAPRAV
jgi:hypothetical protein